MPEGITLKRIIDMDEAAELTSSDYALVDSATGGPKKFALGNELSSLKEDINAIVNTHQNFLEITDFYDGYYWKRSDPLDRSSSSGYNAFYGIDVEANKTYYYKHIFLYYSVVVYEGTTSVVTLTSDTTQDMSGSFTPSANGKIYLTYNKTLATPLFTDDESLYNAGSVDTYYTPNKLKTSEQPLDTDDLITSVGYIDGKYIDGSGNPSANASFRISEFIPVESDTIYDIAFTGQMMVATYKDDLTFIARQILNSNIALTISKIHIPSTAKYVRLSWAITTQPYTKFAKRIDGAEFHVGANYPYLNLSDAVNDAILSLDSVVRIHDGTYDLYAELGGSDYFDSYTYADNGEGLVLKNRVHLIGSSASLITFDYTGTNAQVKQYFSVFNAGAEGFTLENVNIECSNCRYAIHDERYTNTDLYVNKYLNCNMEIDNSANSYGYRQCIGGGLGTNGAIVIKDCNFKTIGANVAECVSYHNSSSSSAKSRIIASGNYCDNGTMRFSWHGTSTKTTEVIASNNSVPSAITTRAEQVSDTTENVVLKAWNNVIRN